jgi:hypothetical protein
MPLVYDCTEQLPCFEAVAAVGAVPVPLEPLELPLELLLDPLPEPLAEVLLDELPLALLPELEVVTTPELELVTPEPLPVLSMPELDPLDPLDPFDPDAPLLPPPLDPRGGSPDPVVFPAAQAPMARQDAPRSQVAVQCRMIMMVSLSPCQTLTNFVPEFETQAPASQAPLHLLPRLFCASTRGDFTRARRW